MLRLDRVGWGEQLHVGADLNVVADADGGDVERHEAEVSEPPGPHEDLVPVVAVEGRPDHGAFAKCADQLDQDVTVRLPVLWGCVEGLGEPCCMPPLRGKLRIVGEVRLTGEHPFPLRAGLGTGKGHLFAPKPLALSSRP